jgi:hypothetical protein
LKISTYINNFIIWPFKSSLLVRSILIFFWLVIFL